MTRVVVQRGVSNAPQSRLNANPSSSSPPVPPPLPPPYVPPASTVSGPLPTSQICPGASYLGEDGSDEDRKVSDNVSQVNPYLIIHPEQKARGIVIENDLSETAPEQISSSHKHIQISKSAETSRQGSENADGCIISHGDYGPKTSENLDGRNEIRSQSMVENLSTPSSDQLPYDNLDVPRSSSAHGNLDMPRASYGHPSPLPSSSRRCGWVGSSGSSICRPGHYRGLQRNSPHGSRSTSPRARAEDGYNSADELNSWTSGSSCYEDNEERESKFEIALRRLKGLEVRRMAEDGNCLFRSVADQVYGDAEMYEETRQLCIDYMEKERDHFSQFVTESFTAYCKRKRRDKVYGNNLEIQAMAEMYNRPIHIYSYSTEPINIFHGQYDNDLAPIRLSYSKGNHYNSIHDPRRPSIGAGLGFGSLHGASANTDQVKTAIKEQQEQQIDRALLAEGRYYSDLEFTEHEIERMVMEASRIEFLAEEKNRQQHLQGGEETSTSTAAEPSSSGTTSVNSQNVGENQAEYILSSHNSSMGRVDGDAGLTSNVRMLLSMGFNYLRVMEAFNIFGDDVNNMLCYLLEVETNNLVENMYRKKGKAAET